MTRKIITAVSLGSAMGAFTALTADSGAEMIRLGVAVTVTWLVATFPKQISSVTPSDW